MPVIPPVDGSVTLPELLDFHCKHNADLPMYIFPNEGSLEATTISFLEFGRACHRAASILRPGRGGPDKQVVAVIALSDTILYQAIVMGLMRAGLVVRHRKLSSSF